jgi:magnesium-protoporphyrin O-methyltransferase
MNTYIQRRGQIETYFDRTAAQAWARLTSDAPLGRVRAGVRRGRDSMRELLLSWLPDDLRGMRVLDAGCGTGAFSVAAAQRGARVLAIDLSPTLVDLARERHGVVHGEGAIDFRSGDMLDPALGSFDYVIGMDSLIHYQPADAVRVLNGLAQRTRIAMIFTFVPSNPLLATMRAAGKLFPRGDRSPAVVPVTEGGLRALFAKDDELLGWTCLRTQRVASGFYTSQAMQLSRSE